MLILFKISIHNSSSRQTANQHNPLNIDKSANSSRFRRSLLKEKALRWPRVRGVHGVNSIWAGSSRQRPKKLRVYVSVFATNVEPYPTQPNGSAELRCSIVRPDSVQSNRKRYHCKQSSSFEFNQAQIVSFDFHSQQRQMFRSLQKRLQAKEGNRTASTKREHQSRLHQQTKPACYQGFHPIRPRYVSSY